jgi:hypothetical protein
MRSLIVVACAFCLPVGIAWAEPTFVAKADPSAVRAQVSTQVLETAAPRGRAALGVSKSVASRQIREQGFKLLRLVQDDEGNWLGEAMRGAELIDVAVDLEGNLITW